MTQLTRLSARPQFDTLRNQLGHHEALPFLEILSRPLVEQACRCCDHPFRDRVYTPWVPLGIFLSQILSHDQSCDDALEHFLARTCEAGAFALGVGPAVPLQDSQDGDLPGRTTPPLALATAAEGARVELQLAEQRPLLLVGHLGQGQAEPHVGPVGGAVVAAGAARGVVRGGVEAERLEQFPPGSSPVVAPLAAAPRALPLASMAGRSSGMAMPAQQPDDVALIIFVGHESSLTAALENP